MDRCLIVWSQHFKGDKTIFKDEINSILRDENMLNNDTSFALSNPIN